MPELLLLSEKIKAYYMEAYNLLTYNRKLNVTSHFLLFLFLIIAFVNFGIPFWLRYTSIFLFVALLCFFGIAKLLGLKR